jgi:F-type H+-transporting ATPase subunit delta
MTGLHPIARRYAKAIFDLAHGQGVLERVTLEVRTVGDVVAQSQDLALTLTDPTVPPATRKAIMAEVVQRLGVSPLVRNAVLLVTDHGRAGLLPRIAGWVTDLADERAGKVRAEVTSATPLTEAQYARLTAALERLTGRRISLQRHVDPALIGGVVTRLGDKVYDGSVKTSLADLRLASLPS